MSQPAIVIDPPLITMGIIVPKAYYRYTIPSTPANIINPQNSILDVEFKNEISIPKKRLPLVKLLPSSKLPHNYSSHSSCHLCHNKIRQSNELLKCKNRKIRFNLRIDKTEFEKRIHSSQYSTSSGQVKKTPYSYNQLCRYGYCFSCLRKHFHYTDNQFRNAKLNCSWKCFVCTKQCTCTKCKKRDIHKPELIHLEQN